MVSIDPTRDQDVARAGAFEQSSSIGPIPRANDATRIAALQTEIDSLRKQVQHDRLILDSAVDYAILTLDATGRITSWNAGAAAMMGYAEAEMVGQPGDLMLISEDRSRDKFAADLSRAGEAGRLASDGWYQRRDGSRFWANGMLMPILDAKRQLLGFVTILRNRTDLRAATEQRELLMAEMNHRIKNSYAMVQALASQCERFSASSAEFHHSFRARLAVLARSNDALIRADWHETPLQDVIAAALEAFDGEPGRITIDGPSVMLAPDRAANASLAFHELTINAVKHGALSAPSGQVEVSWVAVPACDGGGHVDLVWRERGGPAVEPPVRHGFGFQLLHRGLPSGSTIELDFRPAGLECRLRLPLSAA